MLECDRTDFSEGIDINKTNASKQCGIFHCQYFLDKNFKYEPNLCNGRHELMQKAANFNDAAIVSVKESGYRIHFWYMNKNDGINIMKSSTLSKKMDHSNFLNYI